MKDNKNVLNEAFFKKSSYTDNVKKRMPAYEPLKADSSKIFGNQAAISGGAFAVTDAAEMKKRLVGTFGAAFGDNNIKSMAGKAIKTFPIIISDNVEPETAIALKRLMEEQYADYISLLVSNKVIDLSAYDTASEDGSTIAIQALDTISGTDFSKNRIANKAMNTGEISMDDIGANVPLYNLLRENHVDNISTGDVLYDELLENALVVPADKVDEVVKYIRENADSLILTEDENGIVDKDPNAGRYNSGDVIAVERSDRNQPDEIEYKAGYEKEMREKKKNIGQDQESLAHALARTANDFDRAQHNIKSYDNLLNTYTGNKGYTSDGRQLFDRLSNAEITVNKGAFDTAMNRTVGELLMDPKNAPIKDRFEKASILLQAEMITGSEYIDYCTMRLGIPISATTRATLSTRFRRAKSLERSDDYKNGVFMTDLQAQRIKQNRKLFEEKVLKKIANTKIKAIVAGTVSGLSGGAAIVALSLSNLILAGVLAGVAVGTGAYAIYNLIKKHVNKKNNSSKIEGWERVEMLIDAMDRQRAEVIAKDTKQLDPTSKLSNNIYSTIKNDASIKAGAGSMKNYQGTLSFIDNPKPARETNDDNRALSGDELDAIQKQIDTRLKQVGVLTESTEYDEKITFNFTPEYIKECIEIYNETMDECMQDETFRNMMTEESLFEKRETTMPMKIKYIEKKPGKDVLITPEFSARSIYAYGSTEIDNKAMKDRKYNQPLLMTIKFKQRFDDGKFSDNELTAVIGILGKVIRVPSDEMKYVLTENANDKTIKGIFKTGDIKNAVSDLLSVSKINSEVKNLPQSADVWKNLEKVAALAVANKYSGKKSGNVANAHIVFSEKEIDDVRIDTGIDYKRDMKLVEQLMKRYSAFTLMIADDPSQRVYIYNDEDDISWNVVPYSAILGKDTGDQLTSALARLARN